MAESIQKAAPRSARSRGKGDTGREAALFGLFFASGVATLVYEVLWLDELGLVFGNTAEAAATTLAVFFLGLALGGDLFGRHVARLANPLRAYAVLEWAIGASALLFFLLTPTFRLVYRALYPNLGENEALLTVVKLVLAGGILLLPATLIGGTLPLMGQHLVRKTAELGRTGTLLYLVNTLGAATGALLAGFVLPPVLGLTRSYVVAIALNALVGAVAWWLARGAHPLQASSPAPTREARSITPELGPPAVAIGTLAFLSGALVLGMEVVFTRLYALVLHNSVYSFAVILVAFLLALAAGSLLAHVLGRQRRIRVELLLAGVAAASAVLLALSVGRFLGATRGLREVDPAGGWSSYLAAVASLVAGTMVLPCLLAGTLYPLLLAASQHRTAAPGSILGRLAAVNSVGGILGSLLVGFVLLPLLGIAETFWALAVAYLAAAAFALFLALPRARATVGFVLLAGLASLLRFPLAEAPLVTYDAAAGERLLDLREGRHGSVAVIGSGGNLALKVDNHYALGDVASADSEVRQAQIPLFLVEPPRSVFFLGMGTGITAGAALPFPVERVVVAELIPEVVEVAETYFAPHTGGLFADPRVHIVVEDGRHYLMATSETFDLVVSDLFVPWHAGTGSLYTREHFADCRARLAPQGTFVLWIPGGQITRAEFDVLVRTLLEVFPHVTAWRGEFAPNWPTLALVASLEERVFDPEEVRRRLLHVMPERPRDRITDLDVVPWLLYAGNVGASRELFANAPLNTDDHPYIEYTMPKTQRRAEAGEVDWLRGDAFLQVTRDLFAATPPGEDPALARLDGAQQAYIAAGVDLYATGVLLAENRIPEAAALYRRFLATVPLAFFAGLERE